MVVNDTPEKKNKNNFSYSPLITEQTSPANASGTIQTQTQNFSVLTHPTLQS